MFKLFKQALPAILLAFLIAPGAIQAAVISASSEFEGGIFGDWTIDYSSGPSNLLLQQAKITLGSGNFFDTTISGPGYLLWQDLSISPSEVSETGYVAADPPTAALRNGAFTLTLFFNDFNAGETFSFALDVDEGITCGSGFFAALCHLDGSLMSGDEFAGATIEYLFGGEGYSSINVPVSTYYSLGGKNAESEFSMELAPVPEPSTIALLGTGLVAIGAVRRRRAPR